MKTILVLTDFSARSDAAADYAMHMAIETKSTLVLAHITELTAQLVDGVEFTWPIADQMGLKNNSIAKLKELQERLARLTPHTGPNTGYRPSTKLETDFGLLSEVAERLAGNYHADLIVIGAHKPRGLSKRLFGGHTYSLLDKATCPVLIVPQWTEFNGISRIAYATDRSFNDQHVIDYLVGIAKYFKSTIAVQHVTQTSLTLAESEQAIEYCLNDGLEDGHPPVHYEAIENVNVGKALTEVMQMGKIDMLALVHKRYDFFANLFHSSMSKRLADHAQVPVLVLPHSFSADQSELQASELDRYCFEAKEAR